MLNKTIGTFIRDARKKKGLTQEELANRVYVQKQAVSQWETGKTRPNLASISLLSKELDINFAELIEEEEKNRVDIPSLESFHDYKALESFTDFNELISTAKRIVKKIEIDSLFEKTVSLLLEYTLYTVLGYECYYHRIAKKQDDDISGWEQVAWDIANLLDSENEDPIFEGCTYPFPKMMSLIEKKIMFMSVLIGGKFFENFNANVYRNGFVQQIGRFGESCGYDLLKVFPQEGSDIFTVYKVSLLKLSEYIDSIQ